MFCIVTVNHLTLKKHVPHLNLSSYNVIMSLLTVLVNPFLPPLPNTVCVVHCIELLPREKNDTANDVGKNPYKNSLNLN